MPEGKLPDLPGSTDADLKSNQFHPFFKKTAREIWEGAEINHTEVTEHKKCDHFFIYMTNGVECRKCHIGYEGVLQIDGNGKIIPPH